MKKKQSIIWRSERKSKWLRRVINLFLIFLLFLQIYLFPVKPIHSATNTCDFTASGDYSFDSAKIEVTAGQAQLKSTDTWYNDAWGYRIPITITNGGVELTNYKVKLELTAINFDFTKAQSNGEDIRFTSSDGTTLISHGIQSYDSVGQTATLWPTVPTIAGTPTTTAIYMYYGNSSAEPYDYFKFSIDETTHNDYGAAYPLTYQFSIPAGQSGLKAYRKYTAGQDWVQITEKTITDWYNGIEAVRFDYTNNKAYVSAAFASTSVSNDILIKITNSSNKIIHATYEGITKYYDNRTAAVTASSDDWDGNSDFDTKFQLVADAFASRYIWLTVGVTTQGIRTLDHSGPTWSNIQSKIDAGYIEIASHSQEHLGDGGIASFFAKSYSGAHDGLDNAGIMTDSTATFPTINTTPNPDVVLNFVGWEVQNTTDGSSCTITASDATTITCALAGGTDNDWDVGDTYLIDRYDEEIAGSKQDIIDNLNLPYSNDGQEYVYAYLEPYGISDSTMQLKLGQNKYLSSRSVNIATTATDNIYADWDNTSSLYNRNQTLGAPTYSGIASSYKYGFDAPAGNVAAANTRFDSVIAAGGIYHVWGHPYQGGWTEGSWNNHLDHIKGSIDGVTRTNNYWYVGYGYLNLYHYLDERDKISVSQIKDSSTDTKPAIIRDDFSGSSIDTSIWTPKTQNTGTATVTGGNAILDPRNSFTTTSAIRSVQSNFKKVTTNIKGTDNTRPYLAISIGTGDMVNLFTTTGAETNRAYTTFTNGYFMYMDSVGGDVYLKKIANGVEGDLGVWNTDVTTRAATTFHQYEIITSDSGVTVERDDVVRISSNDTTYSSGGVIISSGETGVGWGDTVVIDWAEMSGQYAASEPSSSAESETGLYSSDNPTIQPTAGNALTFTSLSQLNETATKHGGEIKYALSNDAGSSWKYYNSGWVASDSSYTQANTASEVNTEINSFPKGSGQFLFKSFFHSDGASQVQLDNVTMDYENDTSPPTASIDYSDSDGFIKAGDSLTITATFDEPMADSPAPKIAISGSNTQTAIDMTKIDSTHYYYTHTVGAGNGAATVALSVGTDIAGNVVTSAPTSGATFTVDNMAPIVVLSDDHADNIVRDADVVSITADFTDSSGINESSPPTITIGSVVSGVAMTRSSNTEWTYAWNVPSANDGDVNVFISATDVVGNANSTATGKTIYSIDNTAPNISDGMPSGALSSNVTSASLVIATGEVATCRYSTTTGTAYGTMTNTFLTTGGTSHSTTVNELSAGNSYSYYIKCQDRVGNTSASDYVINFSIASPLSQSTPSNTSSPTVTPTPSSSPDASANVTPKSQAVSEVTPQSSELPAHNTDESVLNKIERFFKTKILQSGNERVVEMVKIQIIDKQDKPISNLEVTIHSNPQTSKTNENGVVTFSNISVGKHSLVFVFQGEKFNKKVSIADPDAELGTFQAEILTIKAEKDPTPIWVWVVISTLSILVLTFAELYVRKRR